MLGLQAIICVAAMLILLACRYDVARRLSAYAIIASFAAGLVMMIPIGWVDDAAFAMINQPSAIAPRAAAVAFIEESGKLLVVVLLAATLFHKKLQEPLDGLLIGQMVGLGMGLDEALLYVQLDPAGLQTLGMQIVRLFAHALMAGIIGFGVGCVRSQSIARHHAIRCLLLCVSLTTAIHFSWNLVAYARQTTLPAHLIPMLLMLTLMLLWKTFCTIAQRHAAYPLTTELRQTA